MATEKLAKGLLSDGAKPPELTHKIFFKFVRNEAGEFENVRVARGFDDKAAFNSFLRGIWSIAQFIQDLHPSGVTLLNTEYPWEQRALAENGIIQVHVHVPIRHEWEEWTFSSAEESDLRKFLDGCFLAVEEDLPKV